MNRRELKKSVRENRKRLFLSVWRIQKTQGVSLASFCRDYGLSRENFYRWLKEAGELPRPNPIVRADPNVKQKAIEIYLRYKGTWGPETISLALGKRLSSWTIGRIVRPYKNLWNQVQVLVSNRPAGEVPIRAKIPNLIWSVDWTEYKLRGVKVFISLIIDEGSRFCLGWRVSTRRPNSADGAELLDGTASRYSLLPLLLKSDRAPVFFSSEWESALKRYGIAPYRIRPHCPQDQGTIERFIRELKAWLRANEPRDPEALSTCLEEGIFMLNFLKPRHVLAGRTPAAAYFDGKNERAVVCADAVLLKE